MVTVEPVRRYLRDFVARNRPGSVRSYAYALLRWWRWLRVVQVEWDRATSAEVRDLVLWLKQATKPRTSPRTTSAATAGMVNPITRKRNRGDQYQPRTIRHSNAVIRSFYEFWIELGHGPLANPAPLDRRGGRQRTHGWLGEVQGLQVSLTKAKEKLATLDRSLERTRSVGQSRPTDLGMPVITRPQ
ncbi:site-specific integrase [Streptomyces sp. NPDC021622]|uniref:site-specific integrase n=1 Tax=Streptomyces sp. NPDC021622 TaxID=3155013 RepID=UPI0033C9A063